jgi:hypothetical protein
VALAKESRFHMGSNPTSRRLPFVPLLFRPPPSLKQSPISVTCVRAVNLYKVKNKALIEALSQKLA